MNGERLPYVPVVAYRGQLGLGPPGWRGKGRQLNSTYLTVPLLNNKPCTKSMRISEGNLCALLVGLTSSITEHSWQLMGIIEVHIGWILSWANTAPTWKILSSWHFNAVKKLYFMLKPCFSKFKFLSLTPYLPTWLVHWQSFLTCQIGFGSVGLKFFSQMKKYGFFQKLS